MVIDNSQHDIFEDEYADIRPRKLEKNVKAIKQWALTEPLSATYVVNKHDPNKWAFGHGLEGSQPDTLVHFITTGLGKKPVTIGSEYNLFYHPYFKEVLKNDDNMKENLVIYNEYHFKTEKEFKKIHDVLTGSASGQIEIKNYDAFYLFMKNSDKSAKYAALRTFIREKGKLFPFLPEELRSKLKGLVVGIIDGILYGYDKIDIFSNYQSWEQFYDLEKRKERLITFDKEWDDANMIMKALMQSQPVIDRKNEMIKGSIPVHDIIKKFKDGRAIVDNIFDTGKLTFKR